MIDETVKIHNNYSIEIKLGFVARKKLRRSEFAVNTWMFIPNSLDINPATYEKKDFYRDLKSNIRLITPVYLLRDIADGPHSPLINLEKAFHDLATSPTRTNITEYEYHIKMFLSIFKSSLRNETIHICNNKFRDDHDFLIDEFASNIYTITTEYRNLRRIINVPTIQADLMNYYLFGDEFMSNVLEQHTFRILRHLDQTDERINPPSRSKLLEIIKRERGYKTDKKYMVTADKQAEQNRELLHRLNLLKKYAENVLFLSTRKKKDGIFKEQIYYSIAAGLSMVFATAIAFSFQMKYGNFTMPFFVALVVSYMLKDRIKELSRYYFAHRLGRGYFDHKTKISLNLNKIGWSKEAMDFIAEQKVPDEVLRIRNRSAILEADNRNNDEKIILYRKLVKLNRNSLDQCGVYQIAGINDIIRFNISNFTNKMDNPEVPLHYLGVGNRPLLVNGEKIYYLNLIMQLRYEGQITYKRYRLVVNRDGIKQVETFD